APLAAGCAVTGCALGGLVMLSQVRWFPSMWQDKITPALVASAFPSVVAFCLLSGALGLAAAALTTRLIPAITATFAVQVALSYAGPALAVRLAPTRVAPASAVHSGHLISEQTRHGTALVTYAPNSEYWTVALAMSAVLLILAAGLAWFAIARITRLSD
nr:hypothetical protein [Actinomycetota bacterium]